MRVVVQRVLKASVIIQHKIKSEIKNGGEIKVPLYYENSKVRILKYENQDFILVR